MIGAFRSWGLVVILTEEDRRLVEASYEGTPETIFVMRLGRELANLRNVRDGQSLATLLMTRLTDPSLPEQLPVENKDRFRDLQKLFLLAFARFSGVLPETPPETKH